MEDQLYNTNERLEAMLSALPDLMFRIDQDGCIHECHFSSIDRLYVPPSAFMGKKIADVIPEETTRIIMTALGEAATRGSYHGATYSLTLPKGLSWYELSIAMMGEKKQSDNQFIVLIRDITERRRTAEALHQAYQNLELRVAQRTSELTSLNDQLLREIDERRRVESRLREAKLEAEQANLSKTKFLAAVSHDLLQPLNAARLFTGALLERRDPRPMKPWCAT